MQEEQIQIKDESGDKNYFTIIPNYILNHSTAVAQALYLQLKRLAGDNGTAYPSRQFLMDKLGISKPTLLKEFKYLLDKKWIEYVGEVEIQTSGGKQKTKGYKIIDLWKVNTDYYSKGVKNTPILEAKGVKNNTPKGVNEGGKKETPKEEPLEEEPLNNKKEAFDASPISILRSYFIEQCKKNKGFDPEMSFGKEGGLLKEKLKRYSQEQLKDLVDRFINSKVADDLGCTLSICLSAGVINQWLAGNLEKKKKPYFQGMRVVEMGGKKYCLPNDGGEKLEFCGKESEIIYK